VYKIEGMQMCAATNSTLSVEFVLTARGTGVSNESPSRVAQARQSRVVGQVITSP